jgi:hypothetical protein
MCSLHTAEDTQTKAPTQRLLLYAVAPPTAGAISLLRHTTDQGISSTPAQSNVRQPSLLASPLSTIKFDFSIIAGLGNEPFGCFCSVAICVSLYEKGMERITAKRARAPVVHTNWGVQ